MLGFPMTLLLAFVKCPHPTTTTTTTTTKVVSPVLLVDLVAEAHGVDDGELEAYVALLELVGVGLELNAGLVVLSGLPFELGVEQGVHEGGLPKAGLPFKKKTQRKIGGGALLA